MSFDWLSEELNLSIVVGTADAQPQICVVCGAPAMGSSLQEIKLRDTLAREERTVMMLLQVLFFFLGALLFWRQDSSRVRAQRTWVSLPHCNRHGLADIRSRISLEAVDLRNVRIRGAHREFCQAVVALQAPPSPDLLSEIDPGPSADPNAFFESLDKSAVQTPADFLKNLERESETPQE